MHNSKLDRAKQFMPFAALRGYYDLIRQCERITEPRKDLSDSEAEIISNTLNEIKKGMLVKVKYYKEDAYDEITGLVSVFNETLKFLSIVKTKIEFDDIIEISIVES